MKYYSKKIAYNFENVWEKTKEWLQDLAKLGKWDFVGPGSYPRFQKYPAKMAIHKCFACPD